MKILTVILLMFSLSACNLTEEIPSFYDDNESKAIVDLAFDIRKLNCSSTLVAHQIDAIDRDLTWLITYTELKSSNDVYAVLLIMDSTLEGLQQKKAVSGPYCEIKKRTLVQQSNAAAKAIFRRF